MENKNLSKAQIIVERFPSGKDWTLSEFTINGIKRGVGVEDEKRENKIMGETRIDNGIYELDLTYAPRLSGSYFADESGFISRVKDQRFNREHLMVWVKNVPKFQGILWHWGATDLDSAGCYIVGGSIGDIQTAKGLRKGVLGSRVKYTEVYPLLYALIKSNKAKGIKTFVEYRDKK